VAATNQRARHTEIARRYSWAAKQRKNGDRNKKPDRARLITLIRLRELERIFQFRYGRFLPDDDCGRDDLNLVAHHVAHLGGDVVAHVLGWVAAWAPWLPETEAIALADLVAQDPVKFTADTLAWRLGLSAAERTALGITTIGAAGVSKADRLEDRKLKDKERKRVKRAENSSGRPRGRPQKMRPQQIRAIAADAFTDDVTTARSPNKTGHKDGATKPPADAVGTPKKSHVVFVEGEALVGNTSRKHKTRIPTAMRLDKDLRQYAAGAGFDVRKIYDMFEIFKLWHLAKRAYSSDWPTVWCNWVDREVDIVNERYDQQRRQAYIERLHA
jgi:hypothetical protein